MRLSRVHQALSATEFDLACGFLHADQRGRDALVYDLMELGRPAVDSCLLAFLQNTVFHAGDFIRVSDGSCRLHPQLARAVVAACGVAQQRSLLKKPSRITVRQAQGHLKPRLDRRGAYSGEESVGIPQTHSQPMQERVAPSLVRWRARGRDGRILPLVRQTFSDCQQYSALFLCRGDFLLRRKRLPSPQHARRPYAQASLYVLQVSTV